jgi:glutamyl-tRNA synthetase
MKNNPHIRVRIAPSPTGNLHIGTTRTALFNYLFAKQNGGTFVIRIEDTDKERSTPEFEKDIIEGLTHLGLIDEDTEMAQKQSERTEIYKNYLKKLVTDGFAYESKEEVKEEGQRSSVIRFKNPNKKVTFTDMIRGEITFDTTDLGDFVIAKSLEEPLFHLAVVVDDYEMKISHVIRGEDHISNTPRHILIQEAIGAPTPTYAHLPLILSKERKKLSKRDGAKSMQEYIQDGYLQSALLNFIAFLGWHPDDDNEVLTKEELVHKFNIAKIQKGGAIFDVDKLNWFNREHIKKMSDDDFLSIIRFEQNKVGLSQTLHPVLISLIKERITVFSEIAPLLTPEGEFGHLLHDIHITDYSKAIWKDSNSEQTKEFLNHIVSTLETTNESDFTAIKLKEILWDYATEKGRGAVLWPTRYLLSGLDRSPDPFTLIEILGKEKSLIRLRNGIEKI